MVPELRLVFIIVTTKQGEKGKPKLNIDMNYGFSVKDKVYSPLNQAQMADVYNTATDNAGVPRFDVFDPAQNPDARITRTNWMDEIFRTGTTKKVNANISGANDHSTYYVSASYDENQGILINTFKKAFGFRINTSHKLSKKLKVGQNLSITSGKGRGANTNHEYEGIISTALAYPPSATVWYDKENGIYGGTTEPGSKWTGSYGDLFNPVAKQMKNDYNQENLRVAGNAYLEFDILDELQFRSNYGINYYTNWDKAFDKKMLEPGRVKEENRLSYSSGINKSWVAEQTLTYKKKINEVHDFSIMAGYTAQKNEWKGFGAAAKNFDLEDENYQMFVNANDFSERPSDGQSGNTLVSMLSRFTYSYKGKYLLTANVRRDGSSKLEKDYRYGTYPAGSVAWRLSEESFMEGAEWLDNLKLRASSGKIGNLGSLGDHVGSLPLSGTNALLGLPTQLNPGYFISGLINPYVTWEVTIQNNFGVDATMFNGALNVTADYFVKETEDMLMGVPLSSLTGASGSMMQNAGEVKNSGFELAINYNNNWNELQYSFNVGLSHIKNEVVSLGSVDEVWHGDNFRTSLQPFKTTVGEALYSMYVHKVEGIFQTPEEVAAHAKDGVLIQPHAKPGDFKFADLDGDGDLDEDDKYAAGDAFPDLTYNFNVNLQYRNWDFGLDIQGVSGVEIFNGMKYNKLKPQQGFNLDKEVLNSWSPSNRGSKNPQISMADENNNFGTTSDWYVEDGSYMRIKNVMLGYTLPKSITDKLKIGNARLYATAKNLATFTDYSGLDPEIGGIGLDKGQYPLAKTFIFGLNVNF